MNLNFWFKAKSWQSVLAADVNAGIKRAIRAAGDERRMNIIDCEATLDHMLLSIDARDGGRVSRTKHLVTGASARFMLRAAPDIRFNAGVSNFWQKRHGAEPGSPSSLAAVGRDRAQEGGPGDV